MHPFLGNTPPHLLVLCHLLQLHPCLPIPSFRVTHPILCWSTSSSSSFHSSFHHCSRYSPSSHHMPIELELAPFHSSTILQSNQSIKSGKYQSNQGLIFTRSKSSWVFFLLKRLYLEMHVFLFFNIYRKVFRDLLHSSAPLADWISITLPRCNLSCYFPLYPVTSYHLVPRNDLKSSLKRG